jgi:hypothetical protein
MKRPHHHHLWVATAALLVFSANAAVPEKTKAKVPAPAAPRPLQLDCSVAASGQGIECFKSSGKDRKPMNDQDLINFVNAATRGAYLNIRSKKGYERVFYLDPRSAEMTELYAKAKTLPARDYGKAKFDMFGMIEAKVLKLSDELDAANSVPGLVRYDLAYTQQKYRGDILSLTSDRDKAKACCEKYRDLNADQRLEAALQEKNYVSHYLSILMNTMTEPGYCTDSFRLKPGEDQTVALDDVNTLAGVFKDNCKRVPTPTPTPTPVPSPPPGPAAASNEGLRILREKWGKAKLDQVRGYTCSKTYSMGPYIVSGNSNTDRPICMGVVDCKLRGAESADSNDRSRRKRGHPNVPAPLKVTTTCAATVTTNGLFVCPQGDECIRDQDFIFLKDGAIVK